MTPSPEPVSSPPGALGGEPPHAEPAPLRPPSVHARAALTWLAIFPLVSAGMLVLAPLWGDWHPVLRALLLTLLVVPLAVYLVVPQLLRGYGTVARRRGARRARRNSR